MLLTECKEENIRQMEKLRQSTTEVCAISTVLLLEPHAI